MDSDYGLWIMCVYRLFRFISKTVHDTVIVTKEDEWELVRDLSNN